MHIARDFIFDCFAVLYNLLLAPWKKVSFRRHVNTFLCFIKSSVAVELLAPLDFIDEPENA